MAWAKFLKDVVVQDSTNRKYRKGEIVEFSEASFKHWASRGCIERVDPPQRKRGRPPKRVDPDEVVVGLDDN